MIRYNTDLSGLEKYNPGTAAWDLLASTNQLTSILPVGLVAPYVGATAPTGWVLLSDRTIGNAASGGTERANADCAALFAVLWATYDNTRLPIQNSSGAASTRGADAATDFAANKRLPLLDARDRVIAGLGNMGGTSADRLTNFSGGVDGDVIGAVGGSEKHQLITAQLAKHKHGLPGPPVNPVSGIPQGSQTGNAGNLYYYTETDEAGGDEAHNNVQPTLILPFIIKL